MGHLRPTVEVWGQDWEQNGTGSKTYTLSGSEYPAVVIPLATQHWTMLAHNLLYTGVTRGKRLVVLVAQRKAVAIAVRVANTKRRWTKLQEWLSPEHRPQPHPER